MKGQKAQQLTGKLTESQEIKQKLFYNQFLKALIS